MDIASISTAISQSNLGEQVGIAVTKKVMDDSTNNAQNLIKMMELSVNPNLGSKLDVTV